MEISTNSSITVVQRDKFVTDPFFLAARRTLEKYLLELAQRDPKQTELSPLTCRVAGLPPWSCCCPNQALQRLGDWAPAILIPCFACCPDQGPEPHGVPSYEVYSIQDPSTSTPPGQVFFTSEVCQLVLDVHNFYPQEINVGVKDNLIEITAQHQEHSPQNTQLVIHKRYNMPFPLNTDMVQCSLSNDGILYLIAPWLKTL